MAPPPFPARPRQERCVASVPQGHWQTTTSVGALRQRELVAPMVADGPMDGEMFRSYVDQCLAPVLCARDIVILDNLSSNKVRGVRETIAAVGAILLYLPPYSPILNPVESFLPGSRHCHARPRSQCRCPLDRDRRLARDATRRNSLKSRKPRPHRKQSQADGPQNDERNSSKIMACSTGQRFRIHLRG